MNQRQSSKSPKRRMGGKGKNFTDESLYNMGVKLSNLKYGGNVANHTYNQ